MPARERIGIFGGTFDPVHVGHLVAAVNARHELGLDKVLLVVANVPWQKAGARAVTPAHERLALVTAAVGNVEGVEASPLEIDRGGVSYTADTVAEVAARHPDADLYLIVGADVARELRTWERIEEIRESVTLVVVTRPGHSDGHSERPGDGTSSTSGWRRVDVEVPALEISSTDLRDRAASGRPLDYLVPEAAIQLIRGRALYAGSG